MMWLFAVGLTLLIVGLVFFLGTRRHSTNHDDNSQRPSNPWHRDNDSGEFEWDFDD